MNTIIVKKAQKSFDVDFASLPQASQDYVIQYGLTQILNDSISQGKNPKDYAGGEAAKHAEDNAKTVETKVANLIAGVLRMARQTSADPVQAAAMRIGIAFVKNHPEYKAWMVKAGLKPTDKAATDKLRELAVKKAKTDGAQEEARRQVEAMNAIEGDLDL